MEPPMRARLPRRLAVIATAGALAASALIVAPVAPVTGQTFICSPLAVKPGGMGTKAFGRIRVECIADNVPFEYQIQLWERDNGPDQRLSSTGWRSAVASKNAPFVASGPSVKCQTEAGKEELYTRIRYRYGGPSEQPWPWMSSAAVTGRTCQ